MAVVLVVSEHPTWLTAERQARYEEVRRRLEDAAGLAVESVHYLEPLPAADAYVVSGSGAPWALHRRADLDRFGAALVDRGRPVLGLCAGMQIQAMATGGAVAPMASAGRAPERGFMEVRVHDASDLFEGLPERIVVRQDHEDEVTAVPAGFDVLASSPGCAVQALADRGRRWWGTQFHPEWWSAEHPHGRDVLVRFFALAGLREDGAVYAAPRRGIRPQPEKEESDARR